MSLASKLEGDNLQMICQRSVEELHGLFVSWFQGKASREKLTTLLLECLSEDFSHVAPNGQFLRGRGILIGHLQDKYGCYKNRLFQIEIYDVKLLWHDGPGDKCLCTYEEWQSWLPENTANNKNNHNSFQTNNSNEDDVEEDDQIHQFGRLSTCLLERQPGTSKYRWIHVHETWLEAETPQHQKSNPAIARAIDNSSFFGEDTVATGPVEYQPSPKNSPLHQKLSLNNSNPSPPTTTTQHSQINYNNAKIDDTSEDDDHEEFAGDQLSKNNLDANERHLLILMSSQSLSKDQMLRQDFARQALEALGIAFYEMDGANPEERENRNALFHLSGQWGRYPQFFLVDTSGSTTFWGDWDFFIHSHSQGRLAHDIDHSNSTDERPLAPKDDTNTTDDDEDDDLPQQLPQIPKEQPPPNNSLQKLPPPSKTSSSPNTPADRPGNYPPQTSPTSHNNDASATPPTNPSLKQQTLPQKDHDDGNRAKLILLISSLTLSHDQTFRQEEMAKVLDQNGIAYEIMDGADKSLREQRNQMFRVSTFWGKYPQLFFRPPNEPLVFWGTWDEFQASFARNTLKLDLTYYTKSTSSSSPRALLPLARAASQPAISTAPMKKEEGKTLANAKAKSYRTLGFSESAPVILAPTPNKALAKFDSFLGQFEPGNILFLVSNLTLSTDQEVKQNEARDCLHQAELEVVEVDGSGKDYRPLRNELFKISKLWGRYPQIFVVVPATSDGHEGDNEIVFWGDYAQIYASHSRGTLRRDVLAALGFMDPDPEPEFKKEVSKEDLFATVKSHAEEFLEKSHGILEFEPEDDDDNDDQSNKQEELVTPKTAEEKKQDIDKKDEEMLKSVTSTVSPIPQDVSSKRHVSSKLLKHAKPLTWENTLVGLSLCGFDIGTSQGPIADENWYREVTNALEIVSQDKRNPDPRRKLCLPEMVFPTAHVALEGHGFWLSWDVLDALEEWARAHADIPIGSPDAHKGVGVLKSKDAKLWEKNKKRLVVASPANTSSVFHYDWTFSTPFCGKVEGGEWVELDESGMKVELLTDTSVPILFFDEITLFEDDMHDNGQVQFTVKLRVMPTCAYVLARLWLRVDNVVLRVRETRLLIDFFGVIPAVYRDVTWRECWWDSLKLHKLPTNAKNWHFDGKETPAWQSLLRRIPEVELPEGIMKFATLEPNQPFRHTGSARNLNNNNNNNSAPEAKPAENLGEEYLEV